MCLVVWSGCNRDVSLATIGACRAARRLQTTSRPATTVSGNSFSRSYFFLFPFLAQSERVSVDGDCVSNDMQISRSRWQDLFHAICSSCNQNATLATIGTCLAARRSQTTSRPAISVSGNSFSGNYFFLFSFLAQSERVSVGEDCASNDMQIS